MRSTRFCSAIGQVGLEADQVVQRAGQVILAQLDHRMRPAAGARIAQPDRAHRAIGQGLHIARGQHFHRQAAFEEMLSPGRHALLDRLLEPAQRECARRGPAHR